MQWTLRSTTFLLGAAALIALAGCKSLDKPVLARTDAQIAGDVQNNLSKESSLAGPDIQVAATNGVVTLTGQANDDDARLLASTDASKVLGVKQVVNDLTVTSDQTQAVNSCVPPVHKHHARLRTEKKLPPLELSETAPPPPPTAPAPAPEPVAPPPPAPACNCGVAYAPAPMVAAVVPPPVVYPVRPIYGYGPGIGVGIYARPGFYGRPGFVRPVRPYGFYGRGGGFARPGVRGFARR